MEPCARGAHSSSEWVKERLPAALDPQAGPAFGTAKALKPNGRQEHVGGQEILRWLWRVASNTTFYYTYTPNNHGLELQKRFDFSLATKTFISPFWVGQGEINVYEGKDVTSSPIIVDFGRGLASFRSQFSRILRGLASFRSLIGSILANLQSSWSRIGQLSVTDWFNFREFYEQIY